MVKGRLQKRDSQAERIRTHSSPDVNFDQERPIFSLLHMLPPYCVESCQQDDQAAFANAIWKRSQMTWLQIRMAPHDKLGSETIPRFRFRVQIPRSITEDVEFLALRFSGTKAMVGYRDQNILHVVWLDHNYSVYDHGS